MAAADTLTALTAGLDIDVEAFKTQQEAMKETMPQAKKDAFKAKMSNMMDTIPEGLTPAESLKALITGIKGVIAEAAKENGMTGEVPDADKALMKENLKAFFSQPGHNPFGPEPKVGHMDAVKAITSAMMALAKKHNPTAEN